MQNVRASTCEYQGVKNPIFLVNFTYALYRSTLKVLLYMHLKENILPVLREKSRFDLAKNYERKSVRNPILANLGSKNFKNFSLVQTVVVPQGETNIRKLCTVLLIFIRTPSLKVG